MGLKDKSPINIYCLLSVCDIIRLMGIINNSLDLLTQKLVKYIKTDKWRHSMVTLKDIAKEAGVSTVTVSNVINGRNNKVSVATIEKVNKIIERYNYSPNATARSLAMKKSKIIGVVIPNVDERANFLQNPYNAEILGVLERIIRQNGYYLMVRCFGKATEIIPTLSNWNVDGAIFLGVFKDDVVEIRKKMKCHMIFLDTYFEGVELANIGVDDYKGGYLATQYLLENGHSKIAFVGPDNNNPGVVQERYRGFLDAMSEWGIEVSGERIFTVDVSYEHGIDVGKEIGLWKENITAVVSISDILALGIMAGLKLSGMTVPEDISIIGFDNLPESRYSTPQLTTVSQNIKLKAELAANYLFQMIDNNKNMAIDEKIDVEIVERQSVRKL